MKLFDLHQDRSDNALCTTHKNFFEHWVLDNWRNIESMNSVNQVDLPRLKKWNVQAVITSIFIDPMVMEASQETFRHNHNPYESAIFELYRHNKFYDDIIKKSQWDIRYILEAQDLHTTIKENKIACLKHLEGFYFSDWKNTSEIVDFVYELWIRSIWLTRNVDNVFAWWSNEKNKWLTEYWIKLIKIIETKKMLLDLAHLSPKATEDALDIIREPVMVSHTAIGSNSYRNISPQNAKKVAEKDWIIWIMALQNNDLVYPINNREQYVKHIIYALNTIWEDHVAIGTDFDGITKEHIIEWFNEIDQTHKLQQEMKKQWITNKQQEKIFQKNAQQFVQSVLPKR